MGPVWSGCSYPVRRLSRVEFARGIGRASRHPIGPLSVTVYELEPGCVQPVEISSRRHLVICRLSVKFLKVCIGVELRDIPVG